MFMECMYFLDVYIFNKCLCFLFLTFSAYFLLVFASLVPYRAILKSILSLNVIKTLKNSSLNIE